jgi:hypothetical protein
MLLIGGIKMKSKDELAVLEKIEAMDEEYKILAKKVHEIILNSVPDLCPRLWYGMPGYAKSKRDPVLIFHRADKYMTFGLTEHAYFSVEDGKEDNLMECAWFFTELNENTEKKISDIVKKAVL